MVGAGKAEVLIRVKGGGLRVEGSITVHEVRVRALLAAVQGVGQRKGSGRCEFVAHADARLHEPLVVEVEPHHIDAGYGR